MEWIRISSNKLKIMLTAEDARRYELNCESADYADAISRTAFREILTDVRRETGFDATEDKVYIQMYPSKEGGCELFVTRLGLLTECEQAQAKAATQQKRRNAEERRTALVFEALEPLLSLCRRLQQSHIRASDAWQDESGRWWLLLRHAQAISLPYLSEYGKGVPYKQALLFLSEHGKQICKSNAVSTLGNL